MAMDLDTFHYESFRDLSLYCYRAASVVGLLSAEIFGYQDRKTLKYAENLGTAFQLTNIIRDVKEDLLRGRIYIPLEELDQFGVSTNDLHQPRTRDNVKKLFRFQAERAQSYYEKAFSYLPECDRYAQRSGIIMSAIYRTLLDEIEKDDFQVLEHRISLTPLRKFWLAWKTSRQEKRHKKSA
jgi:phytoene synthase